MKTATVVIGIVLTLGVVIYLALGVQLHPHSNAADTEIMEISIALEDYKVDHGHYPTDPATTEQLKTNGPFDPAACAAAAAFLYRALAGLDGKDHKNYIAGFSSKKLRTDKNGVTRIVDPWENFLGYSTFKPTHPESSDGNNPTFDLWSTGEDTSKSDPKRWIKNW